MERKAVIYMKKTTFTRLFATVLSIIMMLTICCVNVGADSTFPTDNNDGSITINKYSTGGVTPVNGVEFSYVKVADAVQYSVETSEGNVTTTKTGLGFTLVDGVDLFNGLTAEKDNEDQDITVNGKPVYSAETLQNSLNSLAKDEDGKLTTPPTWKDTAATQNGQAKFENLSFGIYLVDETYIGGIDDKKITDNEGNEVTVYKATGPYLVSVPTTDDGTTWNKDVVINAKNIVTAEHIEKVAGGNNGTTGDSGFTVGIGEDFTYTISSDVLLTNNDSHYTKYIITDIAGKGINVYLNTITIKYNGDTFDTANLTMTKDTDYTVSAIDVDTMTGKQTFTITLTQAGLDLLNAVTADTKLFVQYTAQLNDEATSADADAKRNNVELTYEHNNKGDQEDPAPTSADVYTYDIDLSKLFENAAPDGTTIDATAVKFELYKNDGTTQLFGAVPATPSQNDKAEYVLDNDATATGNVSMTDMNANSATGEFACNATGKLLIRGLENGTYQLKEIATVDGYSLLKENVTVTIDDGNATISINNEKESIFNLPLTGGAGTWIYTVGGMSLIAVAGILLVSLGKKKAA